MAEKPLIIDKTPAAPALGFPDNLIALAKTGCVGIVEFRGQKPDQMKWTDKKSGAAKTMDKVNVSCEFPADGTQVLLEFMPPRGEEKMEPLPYDKGDMLLVVFQNLVMAREGNRARVLSHQKITLPGK